MITPVSIRPTLPNRLAVPAPALGSRQPDPMDPKPYPTNLLIKKGVVFTAPLLGTGIGVLAGLHGGVAGGVAGGLVGGAVGGGICAAGGLLLDLLRNLFGKKGNKYATIGFAVGGLSGGGLGAYLGACHAGPVAAIALGAVGLAGSGVISLVTYLGARNQQKRLDAENAFLTRKAASFEEVLRNTPTAPAGAANVVRAMANLEANGWRFSDSSYHATVSGAKSAFEQYLQGDNNVGLIPRTRGGTTQELPIAHLPALDFFAGSGDVKAVGHPDLAESIARIRKTEQLSPNRYGSSGTGDVADAAQVYSKLVSGQSVTLTQNKVPFEFSAATAADLEHAVQTISALTEQSKQVLEPQIANGTLHDSCKQDILAAAYTNPAGADLNHTVPLLVQLSQMTDETDPYRRTYSAVEAFKKLSGGSQSAVGLQQGMELLHQWCPRVSMRDGMTAIDHLRDTLPTLGDPDRYRNNFSRLFAATADMDTSVNGARLTQELTPDVADQNLSLMEGLAKAAAAQKGYKGTVVDYVTVMAGPAAGRQPDLPLLKRLLSGLAATGEAEEAAPTYAFLRQDAFGGRSTDQLATEFLTAVNGGKKAEAAREAMAESLPSPDKARYNETRRRLQDASEDAALSTRGAALLQSLPLDVAEQHIKVLETLAGAARQQKDYHGLLNDYVTLMAARSSKEPLEESTRHYSDLLAGLSMVGKADEAGATYAFLRDGQAHNRFGTQSMDDLTAKFLSTVVVNPDCHNARQKMLGFEEEQTSKPGHVKQDDGGVWLGSIRVPKKAS